MTVTTAFADPTALFQGTVLIAAPHMDDEVLACGGTIACLPDKNRVHVAFATDGARSPARARAWRRGRPVPSLFDTRRAEALAALAVLGIPAQNIHFLGFPDGELRDHLDRLRRALVALLERVRPDHAFIPFRYDRHADHLALHTAARDAGDASPHAVHTVEYFVYYRWRLVPGGDIRRLIDPARLVAVDIRERAALKRRALQCYISQTTRFFEWQQRAILPPERVAEVSSAPELFLPTSRELPGPMVFTRWRRWVPIAHRLEPLLKSAKDRLRGAA